MLTPLAPVSVGFWAPAFYGLATEFPFFIVMSEDAPAPTIADFDLGYIVDDIADATALFIDDPIAATPNFFFFFFLSAASLFFSLAFLSFSFLAATTLRCTRHQNLILHWLWCLSSPVSAMKPLSPAEIACSHLIKRIYLVTRYLFITVYNKVAAAFFLVRILYLSIFPLKKVVRKKTPRL